MGKMGSQDSKMRMALDREGFNPEKSHISEQRLDEWRDATIDGCMSQVPGIGPATVQALEQEGVTSSYHLMGKFLSLVQEDGIMPACDRFKDFLEDCETPASHRDTVVLALGEKMSSGFRVEGLVVPEITLKSSQVSHKDIEAFLEKELTGDPAKDFKGLGPKSKAALAAKGCTTSWQLLGVLLTTCDVEEFDARLKAAHVASGWRASITHQCVEKLADGLR